MPTPSAFIQLLQRLGREGDAIRFGHSDNHRFQATLVPWDAIDAAVDRLNEQGHNAWFEVNPSLFQQENGRSSAQHISRLAALWADLDYKDSGIGSEQGAWAVVDDLSAALGVQPAVIVHSGNGMQPYWPVLDGLVTTENRNDIAQLLRRWGAFVKRVADNNGGTADNVFDLPRILRIPGTFNVKDPANPKATTAEFRDTPDVELYELRQMLADYEVEEVDIEVATERVSPAAEWEWAAQDCEFTHTALREIRDSKPASRHHWALKWSGILYGMIRSGCVTEATFETLRGELVTTFQRLLAQEGSSRPFSTREMEGIFKEGLKMAESWSKAKLGVEMRSHMHGSFMDAFTQPASIVAPEPAAAPVSNVSSIFTKQPLERVPNVLAPTSEMGALALQMAPAAQQRLSTARYTDLGNAERLGQWLQGRFIFSPGLDWLQWDGTRYLPDTDGAVMEATKDMFVHIAATASDDATLDWAMKSMSQAKLNAALNLARSVPHLVVPGTKLDADAYALNTPGGLVDLRTGVMRPADPTKDFHTAQAAFAPKKMPIPKFLSFLMWAMGADVEMVTYMQRLFGLALIGELRTHVFPIFVGVGANGKSTLLDITAACAGSYSTVLAPKFLVETRGERHPTELADLRGIRLAFAPEVPPTSTFDEELVKRITGESLLKARFMGKDFFTFPNQSTLFLLANHLPAVRAGGSSFWRRARKIDFPSIMPLRHQNPNLAREILAAEGPGVLQWMIEGALAVQEQGLNDPAKVMIATRDYQLEEDAIARFIMAELVVDEAATGIETSREVVYERYRNWTYRNGGNPLGAMKFARELTTQLPQTKLGTSEVFTNLRVRFTADHVPTVFTED